MTPIVTLGQLCEHLNQRGIVYLKVDDAEWDMAIMSPPETLSGLHCRIDRVPGGFVVHHGKYRELQQMRIP